MEMDKYLGLLKWSLKYSDGTSETSFTPMEEERKKWLQEAIKNGTVDPSDQMKALISVLQVNRDESNDISQTQIDKENEFVKVKVDTLVALQEWVESIDWAMDLHKLDGFKTVIELCQDQNDDIRVHAMEVFATVVQNNPKCQEWALELNALQILVDNLSCDNTPLSDIEQSKNILAISSLVRDCNAASVEFVKKYKGLALLMSLISRNRKHKVYEKAEIKSLFLMRYFLDALPIIRVTLAESLISVLNKTLKSSNFDLKDHALHSLKILYGDPAARSRVPHVLTENALTVVEQLKGEHMVSQELVTSVLGVLHESINFRSHSVIPANSDLEDTNLLKD